MANCPPKPPPGSTGASTDSIITTILAILGVLGTIGSIIGMIVSSTAVTTIPIIAITGAGVGSIGLAGAAGAVAVIVTVLGFWYDRCLHDPDGQSSCSAGVVDDIVPAFNDAGSYVFPFTAQHDMISTVVQCQFWPLVEQSAGFIYTNATDNSPEFRCYFYNKAVCATEAGAFVGAVVGGVAGLVIGIIVGAALGCAGTGLFYFFCLLLACIIAAVIAVVAALIGAFAGGSIGHAAAGDTSPTTDDGGNPSIGDYLTTCGKTIIYGADQHARIYWFVEHSALHGHSQVPGSQQWIHDDPDNNLPLDTCRELCPDAFTGPQSPPPR
jgi:hypothetical protein